MFQKDNKKIQEVEKKYNKNNDVKKKMSLNEASKKANKHKEKSKNRNKPNILAEEEGGVQKHYFHLMTNRL